MSDIYFLLPIGIGAFLIIFAIVEWVNNLNKHERMRQQKLAECYQKCDQCGGEKVLLKHVYKEGFLNSNSNTNSSGKIEVKNPQIISEYYLECIRCKKKFRSYINSEYFNTSYSTVSLYDGDISITKLSKNDFLKKIGNSMDYNDVGVTGCRQPLFILLGLGLIAFTILIWKL